MQAQEQSDAEDPDGDTAGSRANTCYVRTIADSRGPRQCECAHDDTEVAGAGMGHGSSTASMLRRASTPAGGECHAGAEGVAGSTVGGRRERGTGGNGYCGAMDSARMRRDQSVYSDGTGWGSNGGGGASGKHSECDSDSLGDGTD